MITVQPRRDEAIQAGFQAMADRLPVDYTLEAFKRALHEWDVKAFCKGGDVVGMLMVKDNELHVAVLPEVRGRWLSRTLIRNVIGPLIKRYGKAKTKVVHENDRGQEFCQRLGFAKTERDEIELLREGFERKFFDPVTALIGVGGSLLAGAIQGNAAENAAGQAAGAANNATATQLGMFNTVNAQQAPWRQAGESSLKDIANLQPQFQHQFNAADLKTNLAPNYQWQLEQGLGAVKNAGNQQTGLLSGNTLRGVNDYAQNFAGNAYQNAFNNYQAQQNNIFNRLSTIAGMGSATAIAGGNQGVTAAGNAGQAQIAGGQAQAAGTVGAANALTGGMSNALGWYTLPQIMNTSGSAAPTGAWTSGYDLPMGG